MNANNRVVVAPKAGAIVNPLQVLQTFFEYADSWVVEVQRAATQRAEIAAWENVQTQKIRNQRDILLEALNLAFDERRENFRRLFDGLDGALASGDTANAAALLESITDLAKVSPFKELANLEITIADLKRPEQVWDV